MSTREIRRVGPDEAVETAFALQSYAFGVTPASKEERERARERAQQPSSEVRLVAFDDGRAAAVAAGLPMTQNVRGRIVPMLGISGVASHPASRRRGNVRALLERLHTEMRDSGSVVATLWPFRATFYERFGYVGFPKQREIRLFPEGLGAFDRLELPGEVTLRHLEDGLDDYLAYLGSQQASRHGFGLFDADKLRRDVGESNSWLATARDADGRTVGTLLYRTKGFGEELAGGHLLTSGPLGRTLMLRWLAAHRDQFSSFVLTLPPDERPDLWFTDVRYHDETKVAGPTHSAPQGRVLSMEGLTGTPTGAAAAVVEVVDDPWIAGVWTLDGTSGSLEVTKGGTPTATLTAAGLSALIYGVLDPYEITLRGFGQIEPSTDEALRTLFPAASPYLFAQF